MTTVKPPPTATPTGSSRETYRAELARLLDLDPAELTDATNLVDELHLDSLSLMVMLGWLEEHGVIIHTDQTRLTTVHDVLCLLEKVGPLGLSIRVADEVDRGPLGIAGLTPSVRGPADPLAPVMGDRAFRLDPVQPEDVGFLYTLAAQPDTSFRWRYRGAAPSFQRFVDDMWQQVLVQYVARRTGDNTPAGHLVAYGADAAVHHVYVGAAFLPSYTRTGLAAQAVTLLVRFLFHTFPLKKVYLEVPGFNYAQISSGEGRLFQVEGRLRDHCYYAGRYWDQYLCAIYQPAR